MSAMRLGGARTALPASTCKFADVGGKMGYTGLENLSCKFADVTGKLHTQNLRSYMYMGMRIARRAKVAVHNAWKEI